jgi:hypothetical protein
MLAQELFFPEYLPVNHSNKKHNRGACGNIRMNKKYPRNKSDESGYYLRENTW